MSELTNEIEQPLRFQVYFNGVAGSVPERYLCSEWDTLDAAEGFAEGVNSTHGTCEIN